MATQYDLEKVLATIRTMESGSAAGNYSIKNKHASASGAYQYVDSTWRTELAKAGLGQLVSKYPSAYLAPKEVQDKVAANNVKNIIKANGGRIDAVPRVWYLGHDSTGKKEDNVVPFPGAGNTLTPAQYAQKWMNALGKQKGSNFLSRAVDSVTGAATQAASNMSPAVTLGAPQGVSTPAAVQPIDIASIMAQAGQMANQPISGLPDINAATSAYQQSVQSALAQQLQNLDAQFATAQGGIDSRAKLFEQQRQAAVAHINANAAQNQAAFGALTAPSIAAQGANDAAQAAGRAGYGFGALPGTTGGLQNIAAAGAQQIAGQQSDLQAMMDGDMKAIGELIKTQGANDLALGKQQLVGQAQQKASSAVSDYIASMNAERVKALTDYALSTPERQQQFASLLMGGAKSNQDAQSQNVKNVLDAQTANANNYNDFLRLQAQLADNDVSRAQTQANNDRAYALDSKQFDEQVRMNEAKILGSGGATGIAGLSAKDAARVATAANSIDRDSVLRATQIVKAMGGKNPIVDVAATGSPQAIATALAVAAYDSKQMPLSQADSIMRQVATYTAEQEAKNKTLAQTGRAARADALYKDMRAMYDRIALTSIPVGRSYLDQQIQGMVNGISATNAGAWVGTTAGQGISNFMSSDPRKTKLASVPSASTIEDPNWKP